MLSQFLFVIKFPFCGPNKVDSFYYDFPKIIKLACTDATKFEFIVTANSGFVSTVIFFLLVLFVFPANTIRSFWSQSGNILQENYPRHLLLCQLTSLWVFCFSLHAWYVWPSPPPSIDKSLFIVDFAITLVLNPAIYTLRNKDIKVAIKRLHKKISFSWLCWPLFGGSPKTKHPITHWPTPT